MIVIAILMGTAVFALVGMYVSSQTGTRPNGNIILGVSLPKHAMNDEAVLNILEKYRRVYSIYSLIFLLLVTPLLFMAERHLLAELYFFFWFIFLSYLKIKFMSKYSLELHILKTKKHWQVGVRQVISIDTTVSSLKDTFMLSKVWFLLPLAILIIPIVGSVFEQQEPHSWLLIITGFIIYILFFTIYLAIGKMRTKIYSENTEINLHLNHVFKNQWSKCMIVMTVSSSLFYTILFYLMEIQNSIATYIVTPVYGVVLLAMIVLSHNKVKAERNRLLEVENGNESENESESLERDDERYWIRGIIYNNPNDSSVIVEKRLGIGMTMNVGTLGGKLIVVGIVLLLIGSIALTVWAML